MTYFSRKRFWSTESLWPREPEGSIFLARAMLEAAPIILAADLDGSEFTTEWVDELPFSSAYATTDQIRFASRLLGHLHPERDTERPPVSQIGLLGLGQSLEAAAPVIPQSEWDEVLKLIASRRAEIWPTLQMRARVTEWFARSIHDRGAIRTFACPLDGGPMSDAVSWIWNTKWPNFEHVLRNCSANWDAPMNSALVPTHYLFLDEAQFRAALDAHRATFGGASERLALLDNPEAANASLPGSGELPDEQESGEIVAAARTGKITAALKALSALYPRGLPEGLSEDQRHDEVKIWLQDNHHKNVTVSPRTIATAAKQHRKGQRA